MGSCFSSLRIPMSRTDPSTRFSIPARGTAFLEMDIRLYGVVRRCGHAFIIRHRGLILLSYSSQGVIGVEVEIRQREYRGEKRTEACIIRIYVNGV